MALNGLLGRLLFLRAAGLICILTGLAGVASTACGEDSYDAVRPDIRSLPARYHPSLGKEWEAMRVMHMEGAAQLIGLYGDRPIYFLARDAELFYDFAKLVAPHPERVHLLNVSRANEEHPNLANYLAQEGVTESARNGGLILYDTGVFGSMSERIRSVLPSEYRDNVQTHLLKSSNVLLPASRVSLKAVSSSTDRTSMSMHYAIMAYEGLARFTTRSDRFELVQGRWRAMIASSDKDGDVDPARARAYMEDLKAYAEDPSVRKHFERRAGQWGRIRHFIDAKDSAGLKKYLLELKASEPAGIGEAMIRDTIDVLETTFVDKGIRFLPGDFGLAAEPYKEADDVRHREAFITHPELRRLLLDRHFELSRLVKEGRFNELAAKLKLLGKSELMDRLTAFAMADGEPSDAWRKFVRQMIAERSPEFLGQLRGLLASPRFQSERWLIEYLIEHGDPYAVDGLHTVFRQPHTKSWDDLLPRLIERMSDRGRYFLRWEVLNRPERQGAPYVKLRAILDGLDAGHSIETCAADLMALARDLRSAARAVSKKDNP